MESMDELAYRDRLQTEHPCKLPGGLCAADVQYWTKRMLRRPFIGLRKEGDITGAQPSSLYSS